MDFSVLSLSLINTSAVADIDSYEELSDPDVRAFLDTKGEASEEPVSLSTLDAVVMKNQQMNMANRSAKSRMEIVFVSYTSPLRQHGLRWVLKDAQKGRRLTCSISNSSFFLTVQATG